MTAADPLRAELERRLDEHASGDKPLWRRLEEADTRDIVLPERPLYLLGAGSVLARPFVEHALARFDVRGLADNHAAGQTWNGVPVTGDDGFLAAARAEPRLVAVMCCSGEAATAHFAALAAAARVPVLTLLQAARRTGVAAWAREMGDPATVRRLHTSGWLDRFEDDLSRATFLSVLLHRLTGSPRWLEPVRLPERCAYFSTDALAVGDDETLVDGGAFTGDTVLAFHRRTGGRYRRIHAFEPDPTRLDALREAVRPLEQVTVHPAGLWSHSADRLACRTGDGHATVAADGAGAMRVAALDDLPLGKVTLIKMDIEGAEVPALAGARRTIARDKPKLAVCVYHRPLDLIEVPATVRAIRPDYALRLRHHGPTLFETVLYAE